MKRRRALLVVVALAGCHDRETPATSSVSGDGSGTAVAQPEPSPHKRELLALYDVETQQRGALDFATLPPSDAALGADPYRIVRAGAQRFGVLRGESMLVALGDDGRELARIAAPKSPSGIAAAPDGSVLVVGEGAKEIARYRFDAGKLERTKTVAVDALGLRDIAVSPDGNTAYVVEEREGRLLAVTLADGRAKEITRCHGPVQVAATARHVTINCLLDHTLVTRNLIKDIEGDIKIHHDGPLWSFAMIESPYGLLIAAGGVEDHPLLREDGGFGYIDSFVYLYGVESIRQLAQLNLSELGVVTPKWISIDHAESTKTTKRATTVTVAGFATPKLVTLTWGDGDNYEAAPKVATIDIPPGTASVERSGDSWIAANPLLDAWVVGKGADIKLVPVGKPRDVESRIGELLFFTSAMAPWNGTDGKLSRFTCETCHHEGYVDGRTHFTGRDTIHATTRPLLGLFNNAPYFSRALDQSMTQMVHSEFKVANRHNGRDPWFELTRADLPWLANVPGLPDKLSPELLRRSLMAFLRDFTHRTNPAVVGRDSFTALEKSGAATFRDRCASCHAARLIAEEDKTAVAFERWETLVLSPSGGVVWNDASYQKTGVTPYVHDQGTRVPSLRRLYKKWPYFTNGSAKSLGEVLDRFGYGAKAQFHDGAPADATKLTAAEKQALLAFLALL